ncbi:hypothetical protein D3C86_1822330 [compost metagenome]
MHREDILLPDVQNHHIQQESRYLSLMPIAEIVLVVQACPVRQNRSHFDWPEKQLAIQEPFVLGPYMLLSLRSSALPSGILPSLERKPKAGLLFFSYYFWLYCL